MGSDWFSGWEFPDMSRMKELFASMQEVTRPFIEATQSLQEALRPIVEATEHYKRRMQEIGQAAAYVMRPLSAIVRLQKAQFICWEALSDDFIDAILSEKNTNKVLRHLMIRDKFSIVHETIDKTYMNTNMKGFQRLYQQSVKAFYNGDSDLAVTGFSSVFDGLLSVISKDTTAGMEKRINVIKGKLERDEIMNRADSALLTFALTFEKTLDTYSAFSDFSKKEPKELNRHWIAHGRSTRKRTKMDCVKMINLIYGLLKIGELEEIDNGVK